MTEPESSASGVIEFLNRAFRVVAGFTFDFRWAVLLFALGLAWGAAVIGERVEFDAH